MESKATPFEIVLYLIGFPLVLFGFYKASISGYYESEAPMVFGSLLAGAVVLSVAGLVSKNRKRTDLQARDRAKGIR